MKTPELLIAQDNQENMNKIFLMALDYAIKDVVINSPNLFGFASDKKKNIYIFILYENDKTALMTNLKYKKLTTHKTSRKVFLNTLKNIDLSNNTANQMNIQDSL